MISKCLVCGSAEEIRTLDAPEEEEVAGRWEKSTYTVLVSVPSNRYDKSPYCCLDRAGSEANMEHPGDAM